MSYSSPPVLIARTSYSSSSGLSGVWDDIKSGASKVLDFGVTYKTGQAAQAANAAAMMPGQMPPEPSFPWMPVLLGAAVIGGIVIYKRRAKKNPARGRRRSRR